jgi:hypothetical protein
MVMSSNIFAQRYVDGRSLLRYLPLFGTMNDTLNSRHTKGYPLGPPFFLKNPVLETPSW